MNGDTGAFSVGRAFKGLIFCAALMYLAFLLVLTHMPLDGISTHPWFKYSSAFWVDMVIQCGLYTILVALLGCAIFPLNQDPVTTIQNLSGGRTLFLVFAVGLIAIFDEATQPFFGRNFELTDIAADVVAIVPGFCLFLVLNELRHIVLSGDWA